jgi:hypothetical protein
MSRDSIHLSADVFQAAIDCALGFGGVLFEQNWPDKLVDVGFIS